MSKSKHLTFEQRAVLRAWINANRAKLEEMPRFEQDKLAAQEMNFPVTPSQYRFDAIALGIGLVIKHPNRKKNGPPRKSKANDLHDIRMMCFCLAAALRHLLDDLNYPYDDSLRMMSDFQRMSKP